MPTVRSRDSTTIAYDRTGAGPAIIFVAGALSVRANAAALAALLAPRLTVFAYDRRGRGDSGDTPPYAVAREVDDLAALIAEAGGSAFVYGHSSGAVLALEAAARGLAITRLALYEPPFIVDHSRPLPPPDFPAQIDQLLAAGRRGDALERFMVEAVQVPPGVVAQMRRGPDWPGLEAIAPTLANDMAITANTQNGDPSVLRRWAALTTPTLVLDGGASPDWARTSVKLLAETMPNAQHRTLGGQTHGADPKVLAPVLLEFFAG